jgi:RimJ/RimL family protein N-acetyltransferase
MLMGGSFVDETAQDLTMSEEMILVDASGGLIEAHFEGPDAFARALGAEIAEGWLEFPDALASMRKAYAVDPCARRYGTTFFVLAEPRVLVGWGGYKGPPKDGAVEIGYAIAPGWRGRGLATEAARALIARAFADAAVIAVTAHTLAAENASTAVLRKVGMMKTGARVDPEDGPVWAWRIARA